VGQIAVLLVFVGFSVTLVMRHLRRGDNTAPEVVALLGCLIVGASAAFVFAPYRERGFQACGPPFLDARISVRSAADRVVSGEGSILCVSGGYRRMRASVIAGGFGGALVVVGNVRRRPRNTRRP
jgi:hypothetical protein